MNTYRTSNYSDRTCFRRRVDTEDRLEHLRHREEYHGHRSRLPRKAILIEGMDMLNAECNEQSSANVKRVLSDLFKGFGPTQQRA